jgi:uncharacterized protein
VPIDGVKVIDGDGHVVEPDDLWARRMDQAKWGDWIPHVDPATQKRYVGGEIRNGGTDAFRRAAELSGLSVERIAQKTKTVCESLERPGGHDPEARLEDMDSAGIDASVLYPSAAMFFAPSDPIAAMKNIEFVHDCQRAYNDWLSEFCGQDPERLFGIGLVPLQDVHRAVAEARHVVDLGLKGVVIRPTPYIDELPLSHNVYDPFWSACQDLGVPVAFHPAVHADVPGACRKFGLLVDDPDITVVDNTVNNLYGGSGLGQAVGNPLDMIVTVARLLMSGVCERFPGLECIFLESGGGWMPTILQRMDEQTDELLLEGASLSMKPSDYFRRQCYVSFEPGEWNLAAASKWLGTDRIIWASRYPHLDYSDDVVKHLAEAIAPLELEERRQILCDNELEAYSLPIGATP